jgi:hypothetical protein
LSLENCQFIKKKSTGIQEIYKSLSRQVAIPTELLDWARQLYREGIKSGEWEYNIEILIRTKGIEEYYSRQQIEQTIERVRLELQGNTKKIAAKYERISVN